MKHASHKCTLLLTLLAALPLLAADVHFPDAAELMTPARYNRNSSGTVKIAYDEPENALRFDIVFPPDTDKWCYPQFFLKNGETLLGATDVTFEMKSAASTDVKGAGIHFNGYRSFTRPESGKWQTITVKLPETKASDSISFFDIGVNPKTLTYTYWLRNIAFKGTPVAYKPLPHLTYAGPGTVYFENRPVEIGVSEPLSGLTYVVKNWRGQTVRSGNWPENGARPLVISGLPVGYYAIDTANKGSYQLRSGSFTIVIDPQKRVMDQRSFFAVDTAQSGVARRGSFNCPYYEGDTYRLVSDLVAWAGIPHVRDRLSWNNVQTSRGKPLNLMQYKYNADMLKERGIRVSGMFHDTAGWAGRSPKLPLDLQALCEFTRQASLDFGDCMDVWEYWNEQDISFAPEPVWEYAATMKAAAIGFRRANPNKPIANGAICTGAGGPYANAMYLSDLEKYTDLYNFHTYSSLVSYDGIYKANHALLEQHRMRGRAIWCTESGTNLEGNSTGDGYMKRLKAHSPEQELILAEFLPKSQLYHWFNGCSRNYYFVFPAYNERGGTKDWGIMRRDGSVKPSYAAFSTITAQLVSAKMLGKMTLDDKITAFLFAQPDGSQTLCFWATSPVDTARSGPLVPDSDCAATCELTVADGTYILTDLVGTPQTVTAVNGRLTLKADRWPAYISGLHGLTADVPSVPQGELQPYRPAADEDLNIVITAYLDKQDFTIGEAKTHAEIPGANGRLTLCVWNLDDQPKTGRLAVTGGTLSGVPDTIMLPANGKAEFKAVFTPVAARGTYNSQLVLGGTFNGRRSTRCVIPITLSGLFLKDCVRVPLAAEQPSFWRRNDSADTCEITYDEAEKAIRFELVWNGDQDRWFYPEHVLQFPQEDLKKVQYIEFDIKTDQDKIENDFNATLVMLADGNKKGAGHYHGLRYTAPMKAWEKRRVLLGSVRRDGIGMLRIGCNPKGKKLTFWLRNVNLLVEP